MMKEKRTTEADISFASKTNSLLQLSRSLPAQLVQAHAKTGPSVDMQMLQERQTTLESLAPHQPDFSDAFSSNLSQNMHKTQMEGKKLIRRRRMTYEQK